MKLGITITLAAAIPAFAALVGCSSAPKDAASHSASAIGVAEEGDRCGGFVASPKQCDESANLYCKSRGVPDMPGVCTSCDDFGLLPHIAKVCADGETHGAHWIAKDGTCEIEVCPASSGGCPDVWLCPVGQHFDATQCGCAADANSGDDAGSNGDDASQSGDDASGGGNPGDPCSAGSDCASGQCDQVAGVCQ
jgi:hypothetical protein